MSVCSEGENIDELLHENKTQLQATISDTADTFLENVTGSVTKAFPFNPLVSTFVTTLYL